MPFVCDPIIGKRLQVVIDEAGMIKLPMAMVPVYLVKGVQKVTFVGDPRQIPPFTETEVSHLYFHAYYRG